MKHVHLTLMAVLFFSASAQADIILGLDFDDNTTSRTVFSGDTVLVDLFLSDTDASHPVALHGMSAGGGAISQTAGIAAVTQAAVPVALTNNLGVNQWNTTPPALLPAGAISAVSTVFAGLGGVGVGSGTVQIGRFSLQVIGNPGDTATLTAEALTVNGNLTAFPSGATLDAAITQFQSVDLTIAATPVPEPSTVAALGLGLVGFGCYRRRQKLVVSESTL